MPELGIKFHLSKARAVGNHQKVLPHHDERIGLLWLVGVHIPGLFPQQLPGPAQPA